MKRWLVVLLALLLPVQFAWAGAAAYCAHETDASRTQHFGHHEHVHKAAAEKPAGAKSLGDNDCGTCHAGSALLEATTSTSALPASSIVVPHSPAPLPTALARAPDRPQWLRLA